MDKEAFVTAKVETIMGFMDKGACRPSITYRKPMYPSFLDIV